jgi:magnesium-transporting ATPase (P-type)
VLLEQGDHVSADCRLVEAFAVRVDNATITGESVPQAREAGPCGAEAMLHAKNIVLAGTSIVSGRAKAVVFATGMQTEFGRIAHLAQAGGATTSPLRDELEHLSRWIGILAVLIGVLFFLVGRMAGVTDGRTAQASFCAAAKVRIRRPEQSQLGPACRSRPRRHVWNLANMYAAGFLHRTTARRMSR